MWGSSRAVHCWVRLSSPKDYMLFTAEDTGLVHCQTGTLSVASRRMFDWLDENV